MAKRDKNTLYGWAVPKWKPLAVQIKDWFDSYWHKDEAIPITSVGGLQDIINGLPNLSTFEMVAESVNGVRIDFAADGSFLIPAGQLLEKMLVKPTAPISLKIGTANGLDDIAPQENVDAGGGLFVLNLPAFADKRIWLSGITAATSLKFYLRPGL